MTEIEIVKARQDLKELVDKYATESDRNNQDYYVNVFTSEGWKIAERDQYFVFSDSKVLPKLG